MMALTRAPAALQSADVARSLSPHLFSQKIQIIKCPHPSRSLRFHYSAPSEPHTYYLYAQNLNPQTQELGR